MRNTALFRNLIDKTTTTPSRISFFVYTVEAGRFFPKR